jgi:hypothetical protein
MEVSVAQEHILVVTLAVMVALVVVEPLNTMAVGVVMHLLVVQAAEGAEPLVMLATEVKPVIIEVNQVALVRAAALEARVL